MDASYLAIENGTVVTTINNTQATLSTYILSPYPPNETIQLSTVSVLPNGDTITTYLDWDAAQNQMTPTAVTNYETQTSTAETSPGTTTGTERGSQATPAQTASAGELAGSEPTASSNGSSTQTPSLDSANSSSDGFSSGTLAGAIVGSIVGSALLTLLLAFLFFRRRRSSPQGPAKGLDDDVTYGGIVTDKSTSGFSLAAIIPQPADDETVRRRILTLIDHAGLHVDNYYASGASPNLSQDAIARLNNYDSGYLPAAAATVLGERQTQRQVITHLLVYKLLQAIQPGGELLPLLYAAQPRIEGASASTDIALFTWRILTAHLYREGIYNRDPAQTAALTQAAHDIAVDFTAAFAPYAVSNFSETDRVTHFSDLAAAATELGVWLFAQPCTFEFVWTKGQTEITLTPRVLKTYDEQGNRLLAPQVLVEGDKTTLPRTIFRG